MQLCPARDVVAATGSPQTESDEYSIKSRTVCRFAQLPSNIEARATSCSAIRNFISAARLVEHNALDFH